MGRLAGYPYRDIIKRLKELGLRFHRQAAGFHEIWFNETLRRYTTFQIIPETCPRARSVRFCGRPASR